MGKKHTNTNTRAMPRQEVTEKGGVETPSGISQKLMNSLVLSKGSVSMQEVPVPKPGYNQLLVKIEQAGVCRTDVHLLEGKLDQFVKCPKKLILGHEGVGKIVSMGPGVEDENLELKVGDRVGIPWLGASCRNCAYCVTGKETLCPNLKTTGCNTNGTYAEYALVSAPHAIPIPPNIPSAQAAPLLCAGVTAFTALKRCKVRPNEWVGILGAAGGVGHLACQYAKTMGMNVIAIEHTAEKLAFCKDVLKIKHCVNCQDDSASAAIATITGGGLHNVLVTAPCEKAYSNAFEWARPGGKIMCVAICENAVLPIQTVVFKRLKLLGSLTGNRQDCREALQMAAEGKVCCVLTNKKLSEGAKILNTKEMSKYEGRVVLDCSSHEEAKSQSK